MLQKVEFNIHLTPFKLNPFYVTGFLIFSGGVQKDYYLWLVFAICQHLIGGPVSIKRTLQVSQRK